MCWSYCGRCLLDKFGFRIAIWRIGCLFHFNSGRIFLHSRCKKIRKEIKTGSYWYRRYCYWIVYLLNWYFQSICMGTYHTNSCTIYHLWYLTSNSMYHIRIGYSWHYGCDRKKEWRKPMAAHYYHNHLSNLHKYVQDLSQVLWCSYILAQQLC